MQEEQELFQGYEVKNWDFSPRLYKILAASAIFNILALLVVGQTNLLTTKGCDSPLVNKVCQVLDTIYVGGTVLTTDTEYISKDFEPTVLEDAEIIWVDQTGAEKYKYPEGYFALSNPELMTPQEITTPDGSFPYIPGIPNPTTGGGGTTDLMTQPQVLPQPNDKAVTNLPDSPFEVNGNPTVNRPKYPQTSRVKPWNKKNTNPTLNNTSPNTLDLGDKTANNDPTKTDKNPTTDKNEKVAEVEINKEPMKKFASDVKVKFEKKEIDLSQNFTVVAEGVLAKDGKLDTSIDRKTKQPKTRILKSEGNEQMVEVAKQAIAAVGDSGWLGYLRTQGIEKFNFTVVQDNDNLQVIITSDLPTPERANTVSSGIGGIISGALLLDKNGFKKLGEDEKVLLSKASVTVNPQNTKQFVLNFVIPKATAQEMITRKLNEPVEKTTETKPNGSTAQIKDSNKNTVK
jgi:hypothetical protein